MSEADSYVQKWLHQEPGMDLAVALCPRAQRSLFRHWGALLNELHAAVFEPSDAQVAQAKLAWWGDELERAVTASTRHPLLQSLVAHVQVRAIDASAWRDLGRMAFRLAGIEDPVADVDAMLHEHRDLALRIAAIEAQLFGGDADADGVIGHQLLCRLRLACRGQARRTFWPLRLRARLGGDADSKRLAREFASELETRLGPGRCAPLFRRCTNVLDAQAWRALASGAAAEHAKPGPVLLWRLWRAARGA